MSKKIIIVSIIIVLIIIIALVVGLIFLNKSNNEDNNKVTEENNVVINRINDSENNNEIDNNSVNEVINEFYNDMKNKDFKSASELFNQDGFGNVINQEYETNDIEELLETSYNDFEEFYEYSIKDIRQIEGIEDFRNSTNIEITDEEYQEIFRDYILYFTEVDVTDGGITDPFDVYLFNKDNEMVCTVRVMNSYATLGMMGQAKEARNKAEKAEVKDNIFLALNAIKSKTIENNEKDKFMDYCNKESLQNNIVKGTINDFYWEDGVGKGVITNEEGKIYSFTINNTDTLDLTVTEYNN